MTLIDEWENFLERIGKGDSGDAELEESETSALELRFWASYRGQTLARTGLKALFMGDLYLVKIYVGKLEVFGILFPCITSESFTLGFVQFVV